MILLIRLLRDLHKYQDGIGEKLGMLCFFISTFVFSLITGVIRGWQLTLILISMVPLIGLASGIFVKIQVRTEVATSGAP